MKKVRAAIVGYGNIGQYVLEALQAAPDFEIAGVVRRAGAENRPAELSEYPVVKNIKELEGVDVAILCTPTRSVETYAKEILALGINTVDSFDIHTGIVDLRRTLSASAKEHNAVSIISAGWDPGSDSIVRTLLEADLYHVVAVSYRLEFQADNHTFGKAVFQSRYGSAFDAEHLSGFSCCQVDVFRKSFFTVFVFSVAIRFACIGFRGFDTRHLETGYGSYVWVYAWIARFEIAV